LYLLLPERERLLRSSLPPERIARRRREENNNNNNLTKFTNYTNVGRPRIFSIAVFYTTARPLGSMPPTGGTLPRSLVTLITLHRITTETRRDCIFTSLMRK
jgi:hypothetical protein